MGQVISKVGQVLTDQGYSLKDAEQEIKSISMKTAEDNVTTSKKSGASLVESPLDQLKRRVKSDIIIQLWWQVNRTGNGNSASFTLEAFDAYTNKRIATSTGTTKPSSEMIPVLLAKAVKENIKPFDSQMDDWFAEQSKRGREIGLTIRCWDSWDKDLEEEYNGEELTDEGYTKAVEEIEEKINKTVTFDDVSSLTSALLMEKIPAILIDNATDTVLRENDTGYASNTKSIYNYEITVKTNVKEKNMDITKNTFSIYISFRCTYFNRK